MGWGSDSCDRRPGLAPRNAAHRTGRSRGVSRRRGLGTTVADLRQFPVGSAVSGTSTRGAVVRQADNRKHDTSRPPTLASTQSSRLPRPCSPIAASTYLIAPLKEGTPPKSSVGARRRRVSLTPMRPQGARGCPKHKNQTASLARGCLKHEIQASSPPQRPTGCQFVLNSTNGRIRYGL